MPRRSTRAPTESSRRSTRAGIATVAADQEETPPAERPTRRAASKAADAIAQRKQTPSPSPTPPKRGKGRSHGKSGRGRALKRSHPESEGEAEEEEEEQQESAAEDETEEEPQQTKNRGRGRSPARGRGRGRGRGAKRMKGKGRPKGGKKKETTPSDSEDEEEIMEAEVAPSTPPASTGRSSRRASARSSPRAAPAEPSPITPKRRSSRGAAQAASAAIKEVTKEQDDDAEVEEDEARGKKRKADEEEEYSPVRDSSKKPKVDETKEAEESKDGVAEANDKVEKKETGKEGEKDDDEEEEEENDKEIEEEKKIDKEKKVEKAEDTKIEKEKDGEMEKEDEDTEKEEEEEIEKEEIEKDDEEEIKKDDDDGEGEKEDDDVDEEIEKNDDIDDEIEKEDKNIEMGEDKDVEKEEDKDIEREEDKESGKEEDKESEKEEDKESEKGEDNESEKGDEKEEDKEFEKEEDKESEHEEDRESGKDGDGEDDEEEREVAEILEEKKPADSVSNEEERKKSVSPDEDKESEESDTEMKSEDEASDSAHKPSIETPSDQKQEIDDKASSNEQNCGESTKTCTADGTKDESEFVMVEQKDIPDHNSAEVQASLPKVVNDSASEEETVSDVKSSDAQPEESGESVEKKEDVVLPVVNNEPMPSQIAAKPNGTVNNESDRGILFARKYIASKDCGAYTDVSKHFTVASYNILASCHATTGYCTGKQYQWSSEQQLAMAARHPRLLKELQYLAADVICLQEVEPAYYSKMLLPALHDLGYNGSYRQRLDSVCEGEATFYRSSRFVLDQSKGVGLRELAFKELESAGLEDEIKSAVRSALCERTKSVVLLTKLSCVNTGASLTVGNIHVSYSPSPIPDIQCVEVACAIKELVTMAGGAQNAHVICGDFNSAPGSAPHQLTQEGYLNDSSVTALQALDQVPLASGKTSALVNLWWKGFQHTSNSLKSAYSTISGTDPLSTCYPSDGAVMAVDYLWYSSVSVLPLGVLLPPSADLIRAGIPDAVFPSDHLSTKGRFTFK